MLIGPQSIRKFLKNENIYLNAGKIIVLLKLLERYQKEDRKILIFSQVSDLLVFSIDAMLIGDNSSSPKCSTSFKLF